MGEKTAFILTIFGCLIIFGIIFGLGFFVGEKSVVKVAEPKTCPPSLLDSKILENWVASATGEIKEISGRDLVLSSNEENLKISISENAVVQSRNPETNELKMASFEEIVIGKKVEIYLAIEPKEKLLIGHLITILP